LVELTGSVEAEKLQFESGYESEELEPQWDTNFMVEDVQMFWPYYACEH